MKKRERKQREKVFVAAKVDGLNHTEAVKLAYPEMTDIQQIRNKGCVLAKREDIQQQIMNELEKKIPGKWAVEILKGKVANEGPDSIKALSLYFDIVGAKKTEHHIKSESKNLNFNIHIDGNKIQEAIRKARGEDVG